MTGWESWFWVAIFGGMAYMIYAAVKRAMPVAIYLMLLLMLNAKYDFLPPFVLPFIYLFIGLGLAPALFHRLMNLVQR